MEIGFDTAFPIYKMKDTIFPLWNEFSAHCHPSPKVCLCGRERELKRTLKGYQNHNIKVKRILIYSPNVLGRQTVTIILLAYEMLKFECSKRQ